MNDRNLGIAAILLAIFMLWQSYGMVPAFSYEPLGPRAFPMLLGVLIGLCGIYLLIKGQFKAAYIAPNTQLKIFILFLLFIAYGFLFQPLGFIVSTFLAILSIGYLFGGRLIPLLISGVVSSVALYFLFDRALSVVLPVGILGKWL